jgi:hypothetical protein
MAIQIPELIPGKMSGDESTNVFVVNLSLSGMGKYIEQFRQALNLFDYCLIQNSLFPNGSPMFMSWLGLAAREGAMAIYHFRRAMLAANNVSKASPIIGPHLDNAALKAAHSKFEKEFPDWSNIRDGISHAAELFQNAQALRENAFSGTYEGPGVKFENCQHVMIQDALQDRLFTTSTFDGLIVHCEISMVTAFKLRDVMVPFFDCFRKIPSPLNQPDPTDGIPHLST